MTTSTDRARKSLAKKRKLDAAERAYQAEEAARAFESYTEEQVPTAKGGTETRVSLKLDPRLSPVKVAVLPLSRNEALSPKARALAAELRQYWNIEFDDAQSIGRRYRRQDEIGTPYCVTVDFDTLDDGAVTIRERDSMRSTRRRRRRWSSPTACRTPPTGGSPSWGSAWACNF